MRRRERRQGAAPSLWLVLGVVLCGVVLPGMALAPRSARAQASPQTLQQSLQPLPEPPRQEGLADFLRVRKGARTLEVWSGGRLLLTINGIQLGRVPVGPKQFDGDGRTPEGRYLIDWRNPHSAYHLSLHISYPDGAQVAAAAAQGRGAGGMVMIHGQPNDYAGRVRGDWTDGCIALSDLEIETLWSIVPDGAVIEILP